jgi:hypothetical protein
MRIRTKRAVLIRAFAAASAVVRAFCVCTVSQCARAEIIRNGDFEDTTPAGRMAVWIPTAGSYSDAFSTSSICMDRSCFATNTDGVGAEQEISGLIFPAIYELSWLQKTSGNRQFGNSTSIRFRLEGNGIDVQKTQGKGVGLGFDSNSLIFATGGSSATLSIRAGSNDRLIAVVDNVSLKLIDAIPGDFNDNGVVDAADYVLWRNQIDFPPKNCMGGPCFWEADGNLDRKVDSADFDIWRSTFGKAAVAVSLGQLVPEPASLLLFGLAFVLTHSTDRTRRTS